MYSRILFKSVITIIVLLISLSGCKISSKTAYFDDSEGVVLFRNGTVITDESDGDTFTFNQIEGENFYQVISGTVTFEKVTIVPMPGHDGYYIAQDDDSQFTKYYYIFQIQSDQEIHLFDFSNSSRGLPNITVEIGFAGNRMVEIGRRGTRSTLIAFFADIIESENTKRLSFSLDRPIVPKQEAEQIEQERLALQQEERRRLLAEQNASAQDKEKKIISFSDGTEISFCISESTITASIKAASEDSYFAFINRLSDLRNERLCTELISTRSLENIEVAIEQIEEDETGRFFLMASVARNFFTRCDPCDALRSSDRLYFFIYNEIGGDQYGWKGYEQNVVENRTVGGILEFLLSE